MRIYAMLIWVVILLVGCTDTKNDEASTAPKSYMGLDSRTISVNGLTFHYVEKGQGELMLFLHGFPYFSEAWYKLMHEFADNYHTIAPDNRGYGYTEKPGEVSDYHIEKLVADVVQLINSLSPNNKVILVGHDWGASLAWATAQIHPELIEKLIIINGVPTNVFLKVLEESPLQREQSRYLGKLNGWLAKLMFAVRGSDLIWGGISHLHENGHIDDRFKQAFLNAWDQPGAAQAAINWYVANIPEFDKIQDEHYWPAKEARVTVPSLLIWSKDDPAFTRDVFDAIPDFVDDLSIKVIDTNSHAPFIDHTETVQGYMREFIQH